MNLHTLFLFFFISTVTSDPNSIINPGDEDTLVLLHVLFRHGDRTPDKVSLYPNDLYKNYTYEPYGYGQLTLKGKRREYNIGAYMRNNYGRFIPSQYALNVVESLTTGLKRTKMSLELVLAGLFPPLLNEKIEPNLNWQPVPFNVETDGHLINPPSLSCARFLSAYNTYSSSQEGQAAIEEYQEIFEQLSMHTGKEINNFMDALGVYTTLKSEEDFGLKLPEWSKEYYPKPLNEIAGREYQTATATADLRRLSAGFLLKKILDDSYAVANGTMDTKVFLYSGHEYNVGTMLSTLNVFHPHVPPFGATIFFEIHKMRNQYGLKLFYQDYSEKRPRLLTIPGCNSFCPLDELSVLVKDSLATSSTVCVVSLDSF